MTRRIAELGDTPLSLSTSRFAKLIAKGKGIRTANIKAK
jgi:hypothetical protein